MSSVGVALGLGWTIGKPIGSRGILVGRGGMGGETKHDKMYYV